MVLVTFDLQISFVSGSVAGYGVDYGSGVGFGYGDGFGTGDGYGDGSGSGYGAGYGSGSGHGVDYRQYGPWDLETGKVKEDHGTRNL